MDISVPKIVEETASGRTIIRGNVVQGLHVDRQVAIRRMEYIKMLAEASQLFNEEVIAETLRCLITSCRSKFAGPSGRKSPVGPSTFGTSMSAG